MPHLDDVTKQVFAQWRAANPDRHWGWTKEEIPNPSARISHQDPALLGRITTDPPIVSNANYDRMTFLGRAAVAGHEVLVQERGFYSSRTNTVMSRITAVSVDTPGAIPAVTVYPKSGGLSFRRFSTGDGEFDGRFRVHAENRDAARALLSPQVTGFLAADPRAEHIGVTFEHGALSVWLRARFEDVDVIAPMIDLMMQLYQRIPPRVWAG